MKQILYISDVNASEPLFHSQVLPHVAELSQIYDVKLLCLSREEQFEYDYSYRSVPGDYIIGVSYYNFRKHKKNLVHFLNKHKFLLIYSRGFRGGLLGTFIKNHIYGGRISLINDVRADVIDEHKLIGGYIRGTMMEAIFTVTIRYIFKNANALFFVSSYLRNKYCARFKFDKETAICPTFVPDDKFIFSSQVRDQWRLKLGYLPNDIVVLYSGNYAKWQNVDTIFEAYDKCTNPVVKLLIVTKDKEIHTLLEKNKNKENIQIFSADYDIIQNYYFAADYGLLIRDNIETNKCSAPTKFSEYLNAGVILISTDIVADYIDYLKSSSLSYKLIKEKHELASLFDSLEPISRNNIQVNTLKQIVEFQTAFFTRQLTG